MMTTMKRVRALLRMTQSTLFLVAAAAAVLPAMAVAQLPAASDEPIMPVPRPVISDTGRVALGAALFADPRLSGTGTRSCSSCHDLRTNGATEQRRDRALDGSLLKRNTNTVFNATLSFRLQWSGNTRTFEEQAAGSITNPQLMGASRQGVVNGLRADPRMVKRFGAAYGHDPDWPTLLDAIAAFERTLVTPDSRFDLWLDGDRAALTSRELAGYEMFKSIGCVSCHQGVNVGGNLFERWGAVNPLGVRDREVLRVPSLRNVATTPPYFHDGGAPTLDVAIHRMAAAQLGRDLTDQDVALITAFLRTLTGRYNGRSVAAP
jgi:cytochrome c peroxidase